MILLDEATSSPPPYDPSLQQEPSGSKTSRHGGTERRYVYYRVYAPDGAIPSKTAPDPSNPFIGRIKATSVPPPLDVASLKRTLAQAESIPDLGGWRTDLYRLPAHRAPMDDTEKVSILGLGTGIGLTATDALALVFIDDLTDEEKHEIPQIHERPAGEVAQHLYYRLYTRSGEDHSVHAFDPDEPSIGCIDRSTVAPPEDVAAIRRCIARAEGKPIYAFGDLYADVSDEPLANDACITDAPAGAVFHGSTPVGALRIVHPERRPGLFNRPLKILAAQHSVHPSMVAVMFLSHQNTTWLEVFAGEIVHTDGIVQRANYMNIPQPINGFGQRININRGFGQFGTDVDVFGRHAAYAVVNSSGIKGLIKAENVKFLDE